MFKKGIKTVEFWVSLVCLGGPILFPNFPKEAFVALGGWVISRAAQKSFGTVDPITGEKSWETSEFWLSIVYSVVVSVFPDVPQESLVAVLGWSGCRTGVKVFQNYKGPGTTASSVVVCDSVEIPGNSIHSEKP
jgi:hypothetical protein